MPPRRQQAEPSGDASIGAAIEATLTSLKLQPEDAALAQLARLYAQVIDSMSPTVRMKMIHQHAPTLIRVLEQLGATPRARATGRKDTARPPAQQAPEAKALEEIRADRAGRK